MIIGLSISIIGCGTIKANTNVFGGNQHKLPEEAHQLQVYFSTQYFAVKCASLLARFTFPIFSEDVKCFGENDCYMLAFLVASAFVGLAITALVCGHTQYIHVSSNGNMMLKLFNCIKVIFNTSN